MGAELSTQDGEDQNQTNVDESLNGLKDMMLNFASNMKPLLEKMQPMMEEFPQKIAGELQKKMDDLNSPELQEKLNGININDILKMNFGGSLVETAKNTVDEESQEEECQEEECQDEERQDEERQDEECSNEIVCKEEECQEEECPNEIVCKEEFCCGEICQAELKNDDTSSDCSDDLPLSDQERYDLITILLDDCNNLLDDDDEIFIPEYDEYSKCVVALYKEIKHIISH